MHVPECRFSGPILTRAFVTRELPALLTRHGLWPNAPRSGWSPLVDGLRDFAATGGPARVFRYVLQPLAHAIGYDEIHESATVMTREGPEDGGYLFQAPGGVSLRAWPVAMDVDFENAGPRVSSLRSASRVLRVRGETAGLITNGGELRLLLCDAAGPDSQIVVPLLGQHGWLKRPEVPDSFRLITAMASPGGVAAMGDVIDAARLHQTGVTKTLRSQARSAIEDFLQCVIAHPKNKILPGDAGVLWRQALTIVYRLLFILKLESAAEPGQGFSFASADSWRRGLSPNRTLGPVVRRHLDLGHDTGRFLEDGLRILFLVCRDGLAHSSLSVPPLGGRLFDPAATDVLDGLHWGERAAALLLDHLLWTVPKGHERERVHYGALDVEVLGTIYESLLDLEPDIAVRPMTRVRHGRVEAVMPAASGTDPREIIVAGKFFLRTGIGRRSGGSYYTPHGFVRHLVRETLTPRTAPLIEAANPAAILRIKVIDPAMGSGHFLVEACRFLADALYEACRRCEAAGLLDKVNALPDPDHRLAAYLPGRSAAAGVSQTRALAICRRLVTVHCLYGVDRDALAVELAKLSLWLESFAEGLPLTFLDHRLIVGDSIGGPMFHDLSCLPVGGKELDPLLAQGVTDQLNGLIAGAMVDVRHLEASVGATIADNMEKQAAKDRLDRRLAPMRALAGAWSGAVASHAREANDAWLNLAQSVANTGALPVPPHPHQLELLGRGAALLPLDLMFPEVFRPDTGLGGFDAVLGNPPWDVIHYQTKEFLAAFDPAVMEAPTKRERAEIERRLLADPFIRDGFEVYKTAFVERKRLCDRLFQRPGSAGSIDLFQIFTNRMLDCVASDGAVGLVVPSALHANEGTAQLRRRILSEMKLESCFMFENRRRLFDIHARQKFSLLVARRNGTTGEFRCGFYLDSIGQLNDPTRILTYDRAFIAATGGAHETFLELHGTEDYRVARHMFVGRPDMGGWMQQRGISFGRDAHMTDDSHRFISVAHAASALPLHEGKTFHQYTDRWHAAPRYAIAEDAMRDKPAWARRAEHYRLVFREIARSNDERTMIAAIIPPGYLFGHKATCEKTPWDRPDSAALLLCAIFNSFPFDWCVRRKTAASVSLFMINGTPVPKFTAAAERFLAHGALRLSANHAGYDALWRGQLGAADFVTIQDRSELIAAIDAVVARGFALTRDDYRHILTDFNHKVTPDMAQKCLAAFDLLKRDGAPAFYRRFDPYSAIASPTASATLMPSIAADRIPPA